MDQTLAFILTVTLFAGLGYMDNLLKSLKIIDIIFISAKIELNVKVALLA